MIIALSSDGRYRAAYASDIEPAGIPRDPIRFAVPGDRDVDLYALLYGCPLASLGLSGGPQRIGASSSARSELPMAAGTWLASSRDGSLSRWAASSERRPTGLERVSVETRAPFEPCVRFSVRELPLPASRGESGAFGVYLGGQAILSATDRGKFYRVTSTSAAALTHISTSTPHHGAFVAGDGEVWLFGEGRAARGDPSRGFVSVGSESPGRSGSFIRVDGARGGAPFEIYTVSDDRVFARFDGRAWTEIARGSRGEGAAWRIGVAWVRTGEAIASGLERGVIHRYKDGVVTIEPFEDPPVDVATILSATPERGQVAVTDGGRLLVFENGAWIALHSTYVGVGRTLEPLDEGFILGGEDGQLVQFHPGFGLCPSERYTHDDLRQIVSGSRHDWLITRNVDREREVDVAVLTRTDDRSSCAVPISEAPPPALAAGPSDRRPTVGP